jgi:hypothetical protein
VEGGGVGDGPGAGHHHVGGREPGHPVPDDRPGYLLAGRHQPEANKTLGTVTGAQYISAQGAGAQFDGVLVASTDVLVKYTYYGDADLNGVVNFDDYSRIDSVFNRGGSNWFSGDFDYTGLVNFDDYSLIDNAFNTQSGSLLQAIAYIDGSDRDDTKMSTPALKMVVEHFAAFGQPYATGFLNAVPEPAMATVTLGALFALTTIRKRNRRCTR